MPRRPNKTQRVESRQRSRAINNWRGCDWTGAEKAWKPEALSVAELVPAVLGEMHLEQRVAESQILQLWEKLVDPVLARHAKPANLHRGTLFVNVDSNVWLSELVRYRSREILERLQHVAGPEMIQKISYRVGG